jgi:hypothetical protein
MSAGWCCPTPTWMPIFSARYLHTTNKHRTNRFTCARLANTTRAVLSCKHTRSRRDMCKQHASTGRTSIRRLQQRRGAARDFCCLAHAVAKTALRYAVMNTAWLMLSWATTTAVQAPQAPELAASDGQPVAPNSHDRVWVHMVLLPFLPQCTNTACRRRGRGRRCW